MRHPSQRNRSWVAALTTEVSPMTKASAGSPENGPESMTKTRLPPELAFPGSAGSLPALSARLGRMIDELTALEATLREIPTAAPEPRLGSDVLQKKLLALFAQPLTGPVARALSPYEEISPGIRIGFDSKARLQLVVAPKHDY